MSDYDTLRDVWIVWYRLGYVSSVLVMLGHVKRVKERLGQVRTG
jgi:hypothetical protein